MDDTTKKGEVILVGAGCGDPELITIKAVRFLQQADVVLADRLVSAQILSAHVPASAQIINVGKQCRRGISTPQLTINQIMVEHALQGKKVVRLKGGDVSIFSNILDELLVLKEHGIAYQIVPGITAALGAAAYAGMPLTARGYSTAVRFLTNYTSDIVTDAYWQDLAQTNDTLVFYMSSETLPGVVEKLKFFGIAQSKLIAVAEQATTPGQNIYVSSFNDYESKLKPRTFLSPSLVIIGKVVELHEQFAWLPNNNAANYYFKPLVGKVTTLAQEKENQKHVSRA